MNSFVRPPAETRLPARPVAPLFSPPPLPQCTDLSCSVHATHTQPGAPTGPSTSPPCPSPAACSDNSNSSQQSGRCARARTFAAGVCLRAQRGAAGVGEAAARCSGSLHRLEKKKKQNQHPANEIPPPHSALLCSPPEGRLGRPPWAPSRISDRGPRSGQSWRGTAEEFASNTPDSLAFSLKPFRRAQGQLSADPSAPWERSGDAWLLAVSSLWSPGSSTGRIGLRAGCHLVKATGKGCFMGREKGQEVLLPSLATPGQSLNGGSPIWVWDAGRNKVGSETVGSSVRPLSV